MQVSLVCLKGKPGVEVPIKRTEFFIGRDPRCHLRPNNTLVSKRHCVISITDNEVLIRDLGSTNGTRVNGQTIDSPTLLNDGDIITFGKLVFQTRVISPASAESTGSSAAPTASAATEAAPAKDETPAESAAPAEPVEVEAALSDNDAEAEEDFFAEALADPSADSAAGLTPRPTADPTPEPAAASSDPALDDSDFGELLEGDSEEMEKPVAKATASDEEVSPKKPDAKKKKRKTPKVAEGTGDEEDVMGAALDVDEQQASGFSNDALDFLLDAEGGSDDDSQFPDLGGSDEEAKPAAPTAEAETVSDLSANDTSEGESFAEDDDLNGLFDDEMAPGMSNADTIDANASSSEADVLDDLDDILLNDNDLMLADSNSDSSSGGTDSDADDGSK
ncbi:Glycogen accumulation regulator GarA [Planctomycetes bacterium Pan216]|uniref:Glycogen accumulation regulator GarA n=1 Tax=Kolteria novifilia TaxID=2527975 RepID=A0A518B523_9BACT|nr:Glycogen accumulation regulator GarA [Planctomycetes bacterium Pan216]